MCGIFGIIYNKPYKLSEHPFRGLIEDNYLKAEQRGKEATGIAINDGEQIYTYNDSVTASKFIESKHYNDFFRDVAEVSSIIPSFSMLGHCRLATHGASDNLLNNHPISSGKVVGVHNGIITNINNLYERTFSVDYEGKSDSRALFDLLNHELNGCENIAQKFHKLYRRAKGTLSLAFYHSQIEAVFLGSNFGSLYSYLAEDNSFFIFASEKYFLENLLVKHSGILALSGKPEVKKVDKDSTYIIDTSADGLKINQYWDTSEENKFDFSGVKKKLVNFVKTPQNIKRCKSCVLPETYPLIRFNSDGICNLCVNHKSYKPLGNEILEKMLDKYRSGNRDNDCLVAFSGGRDSSYGLYALKHFYGMNPIAFTYDWGMVTSIARRNQARVLGELGVEHIIRSANIRKKRRFLRLNVQAWLNNPHLGMVPLFSAGDKEFFNVARSLRQETGISLVIFCGGQPLEKTDFKTGFAGIGESSDWNTLFSFPILGKVKLAMFYAMQYLRNPRYFNSSFFDSCRAFKSSYITKDDFVYLYKYLYWDEQRINTVLKEKFDWETATYTDNTWRIGDGYTSFINYIYYRVAGFSEFDVFRSQQIREGLINRREAISLLKDENNFDTEVLNQFFAQIGLNSGEVLEEINRIPKLY